MHRSVDYNPNKPLTLITAGSDRKVKFWDTRNLSRAVKVLAGHSHWVCSAKYNPHHDQLIIRYCMQCAVVVVIVLSSVPPSLFLTCLADRDGYCLGFCILSKLSKTLHPVLPI